MESKENQNLDNLIKSLVQSQEIEAPSSKFKVNLLKKLEERNAINFIESKPLISKSTLFLSFAIAICSIAIFAMFGQPSSTNWWGMQDSLIKFEFPLGNLFPTMHSSQIIIYACVILAIMFYVQVVYLSSRYKSQLH